MKELVRVMQVAQGNRAPNSREGAAHNAACGAVARHFEGFAPPGVWGGVCLNGKGKVLNVVCEAAYQGIWHVNFGRGVVRGACPKAP